MKSLLATSLFLSICSTILLTAASSIDHGQSEMAGHVTETSVILQSRLTQGATLIDGDLPGSEGAARFELATNPNFEKSRKTQWIKASQDYDYIIKVKVAGLRPSTKYYYRLLYGPERDDTIKGRTCSFKTLGGKNAVQETTFVVVTGMNYFFFHEGPYRPEGAYQGDDKHLGYPALEAILKQKPDFFVATGDNVYFDHPAKGEGSDRWTGTAWSDRAKTEAEMRRKFHEQFIQPRYVALFAEVPTYWEVDDHDYRYNDCDNTTDKMPTPQMGASNFREQLPVVDPADRTALTYGTFRVSRDLQIWLVEGRLYRSPNRMPDGPDKTIWGDTQKQWLKDTLLASDATFKILISPTPLIGPDDGSMGKRDNHTNIEGFRYERDAFFKWLVDNGFLEKNFFIACGDRHWQYHSIHPTGIEEFSCGALVQANSRLGPRPGDPKSNDPQGLIKQPYWQEEASAGFLKITVEPGKNKNMPAIQFDFYDEFGKSLYAHKKYAKD
ncbi:MAG TPA: alkaline phosphatase D family protein [Sedimentisphaerales bacterium]|nr:alkaline phosphatase D family protein [Sedimentisphaerales bacterium]